MFFGSIDAAGFITVDKPPVSLWVMGLSVRMLGLSPFAVLLPQALAGIASALVLFVAVRRSFGPAAALIAGIAFALTPVAALVFRYNNPDALLTLLLVAAAWALVRGLDDDRFRWPVLAAVLVGFAFLTKYLQAYLVLPAFALTYLVGGPGWLRPPGHRPRHGGRRRRDRVVLVGRGRGAAPGVARVRTSAAAPATRRWTSSWATTASAGSSARDGWPRAGRPRTRRRRGRCPAARRRRRVRRCVRAAAHVQRRSGRARSAGCSRPPRSASSRASSRASGRRGRMHGAPATCCGARGPSCMCRSSR